MFVIEANYPLFQWLLIQTMVAVPEYNYMYA